jgi:transcriptional regulator with XRE-family HTH domain
VPDITSADIQLALGQRVRQLRKRQGYSQEAFADAAGLHRTWMGAVERGERNLSFHNLVLISNALGITLSRLVSGLEKSAAQPIRKSSPAVSPSRRNE